MTTKSDDREAGVRLVYHEYDYERKGKFTLKSDKGDVNILRLPRLPLVIGTLRYEDADVAKENRKLNDTSELHCA